MKDINVLNMLMKLDFSTLNIDSIKTTSFFRFY